MRNCSKNCNPIFHLYSCEMPVFTKQASWLAACVHNENSTRFALTDMDGYYSLFNQPVSILLSIVCSQPPSWLSMSPK